MVLIGYRGTGKSTVGRILADHLGRPLVSTDEGIVRRAGCTIPEIVERHGWKWFRDLESDVIRDLAGQGGQVVDCGGGAILREENRERLRTSGLVIWLRASVAAIAGRIRSDDQRPSLTGNRSFVDEIEEVLREREPVYRLAGHVAVDTDGRTPGEVAEEVLGELRKHGLC